MDSQFYPLEVNPTTGEPFLRLRQHRDIILTPPRLADADALVQHLNDPLVYQNLSATPYPYLHEHAVEWLSDIKQGSDKILAELDAAKDESERITVDGCPVRYIRQVKEDGSDVLLGDVVIGRSNHGELFGNNQAGQLDPEGKEAFDERNLSLPAGHPEIVWMPGYWLASSHHGQGIMPDALATVMHEWLIPRAGARRFLGLAFRENKASQRVFEKSGFFQKATFDEFHVVRGKERGLAVLEFIHS